MRGGWAQFFLLGSPIGIDFISSHTPYEYLDLCYTFIVSPLERFENCAGRTETMPKLLQDPLEETL